MSEFSGLVYPKNFYLHIIYSYYDVSPLSKVTICFEFKVLENTETFLFPCGM